jgi:hypothetical protein
MQRIEELSLKQTHAIVFGMISPSGRTWCFDRLVSQFDRSQDRYLMLI